jgi:hypothetical protein
MEALDKIGLRHKTDKSSMTHCYLENYEKYFSSWRGKEFVLLELGVAGGASIAMWREFFPKAKVYGIDNNPDCAGEGIFIGSQVDYNFLDSVLSEIGAPDLIIDDASHYGPFTIKTFDYLFPKMKPGGFYVVEDTACFYDKTYGEAPAQGMSEVFNFFSSLTAHVDIGGRAMTGNAEYALSVQNDAFPPVPKFSPILESMHIHTSLWVFKRRDK